MDIKELQNTFYQGHQMLHSQFFYCLVYVTAYDFLEVMVPASVLSVVTSLALNVQSSGPALK